MQMRCIGCYYKKFIHENYSFSNIEIPRSNLFLQKSNHPYLLVYLPLFRVFREINLPSPSNSLTSFICQFDNDSLAHSTLFIFVSQQHFMVKKFYHLLSPNPQRASFNPFWCPCGCLL
jgi:hypothetical protein